MAARLRGCTAHFTRAKVATETLRVTAQPGRPLPNTRHIRTKSAAGCGKRRLACRKCSPALARRIRKVATHNLHAKTGELTAERDFVVRQQALSRAERLRMIEPDHQSLIASAAWSAYRESLDAKIRSARREHRDAGVDAPHRRVVLEVSVYANRQMAPHLTRVDSGCRWKLSNRRSSISVKFVGHPFRMNTAESQPASYTTEWYWR